MFAEYFKKLGRPPNADRMMIKELCKRYNQTKEDLSDFFLKSHEKEQIQEQKRQRMSKQGRNSINLEQASNVAKETSYERHHTNTIQTGDNSSSNIQRPPTEQGKNNHEYLFVE